MNNSQRGKIIKVILNMEKLRHLGRPSRILRAPIKTIFYYFLALLARIKPYKLSFKTLWGDDMVSYLPEGNTFYYYGYCEANLTNFLLRFLKEGDIFFDVGAHIGFYTMLSSKLVKETGKVYSFEPTPWTFSLLQKNTKNYDNVIINNVAVSNKEGDISFKDYGPGYGAYNTAHKDGSVLKKKPVTIHAKTITLDIFCKKNNISPVFVKLDAEGHEFSILQGSTFLLEEVRPILTLEVAGGDMWSSNCKKSIDFLLSKKYKPYEMSQEGFISPHTIKENYKYDNLLFIPEEKNIIL